MERQYVSVKTILNIVDPHGEPTCREWWHAGRKVRDYLPHTVELMQETELAVSVNGNLLTPFEQLAYVVQPNDFILFKVIPLGGGGGGKNPLAAIAALGFMMIGQAYAPVILGAMGGVSAGMYGPLAAGQFYISSWMTAAVAGGITMVGGYAVNAVLGGGRPDMPSIGVGKTGWEESPTYGWNAETNPTQNGRVLPVVYGEPKNIKPFLASRYIRTDGDKQYLNLLYLLGEGEQLEPQDLKINDQPLSNFSEVTWDWRPGTVDQAPIPAFNDSIFETAVGSKISFDSPIVITCEGGNLDALGVGLCARHGLTEFTTKLTTTSVTVRLEYRPVGETGWTLWGDEVISGAQQTQLNRYFRKSGLPSGQYEIQVSFAEEPESSESIRNDMYLEYYHEIVSDDFRLPFTAQLSIEAMATDQLSGNRFVVSCTPRRLELDVYDEDLAAWTKTSAKNAGWIVYDQIRHPRYGVGWPHTRIRYQDFKRAADWNDTLGQECNIYFDSEMASGNAFEEIGLFGRFTVVQYGTQVGCNVDMPVELPEQSLVSTVSNIVRGSFGIEYLPVQDKADAIEITYFPDGVRKVAMFLGPHYGQITGRVPNVKKYTLRACGTYEAAESFARLMLNCNRWLTRTLTKKMRVEAIGCKVGDVIQSFHDKMKWGQGGRIASATLSGALINRDITFEPGRSYKIIVKHTHIMNIETRSEQIDEGVIVNPAAEEAVTTREISLVDPWDHQPMRSAVCDVYDVEQGKMLARVFSISRDTKWTRTIRALEYNAVVWAGGTPTTIPAAPVDLDPVRGLRARVHPAHEDGLYKTRVTLSWRGHATQWQVFQRRVGVTAWTRIGTTHDPSFPVSNLEVGFIYDFAVSADYTPGGGQAIQVDYTLGDISGVYEMVTEIIDGVEQPATEYIGETESNFYEVT